MLGNDHDGFVGLAVPPGNGFLTESEQLPEGFPTGGIVQDIEQQLVNPIAVQFSVGKLGYQQFIRFSIHDFALLWIWAFICSRRIFLARNTREAIVPRGWFSIWAASS